MMEAATRYYQHNKPHDARKPVSTAQTQERLHT